MTVYVDALRRVPSNNIVWRYGEACHMFADTLKELHAMASTIGLRREWFQDDSRLPYYDLTASKRRCAVGQGAMEVDRRFVVATIRRNRAAFVETEES